MLTRIEIDGFKTFEGFSLDLGPHAVVLGPNAAGKSNLFDAIRFLSAMAEVGLPEAVQRMRGHPHELFTLDANGDPRHQMTLAAEVLLPPSVRDPWGAAWEPSQTRIRYAVTLERCERDGIERLEVVHEEATPIKSADDPWIPYGDKPSAAFRKAFLRYQRKSPFLTTEPNGRGEVVFRIHHDGHQGRTRPVHHAESTVLSKMTDRDFIHLFALRSELVSWRFLQLDPTAMRAPSPQFAGERLDDDGQNLAAVLARVQTRDAAALRQIEADLGYIIRGVQGIHIDANNIDRTYQIVLSQSDSFPLSARVASDGTLRILALFTALHDPSHGGLLCMEEPENGVHPNRLRRLIERTRDHVADPRADDIDPDEPLHQILFNSHSPVVLDVIRDRNLEAFFADVLTRPGPDGRPLRRTRIRPVALKPEQLTFFDPRQAVSRGEVADYLRTVEGGF